MKNICISIVVVFIIFGLFYLIGCFISVSFDLSEWDKKLKQTIGTLGGIVSVFFACIYCKEKLEN